MNDEKPFDMFPASAGMNRRDREADEGLRHVPRERGDEPKKYATGMQLKICSPRARG